MELGLILGLKPGKTWKTAEFRRFSRFFKVKFCIFAVFQAFPGFPGFPGHLATLSISDRLIFLLFHVDKLCQTYLMLRMTFIELSIKPVPFLTLIDKYN